LRRNAGATRALEPVVFGLLKRSLEERRPLEYEAWTTALEASLPEAKREFENIIVDGIEPTLPSGALGRCFREIRRHYVAFDLGYDDERTLASPSHEVAGLRRGGPAELAGLREGDRVDAADFKRGDPRALATLTVLRDGTERNIKYMPRGRQADAQAWERLERVSDDRCGELP
jgi:predicted metalloprotease with PDZ domain